MLSSQQAEGGRRGGGAGGTGGAGGGCGTWRPLRWRGASAAELPCELAAVAAGAVHGALELSTNHSADDGVAGRQARAAHLPHAAPCRWCPPPRRAGISSCSATYRRARAWWRCVLLLDERLSVDVDVDDVAVVQLVARRLRAPLTSTWWVRSASGTVGELRGGVGERRAPSPG